MPGKITGSATFTQGYNLVVQLEMTSYSSNVVGKALAC